jgi:hypothetical protein
VQGGVREAAALPPGMTLPSKSASNSGLGHQFQSALNEKEPEARNSVKHSLPRFLTIYFETRKLSLRINGL